MHSMVRWTMVLALTLALIPGLAWAAPGPQQQPAGPPPGAPPPPPGRRPAPPPPRPAASGQGVFATVCRFSHEAADDPIVFPGQAGRSHLHTFFGNTSTDAASTYESLQAAGTTCRTAADTSGYWTPALYQNSTEVQPVSMKVYYRTGRHEPASVQPFPPGFRVIAGDATATSAQGLRTTFWRCQGLRTREDGPEFGVSETPPTCPADSPLTLHVRFPECWDGVSVDSPDHKSHMAYGAGRQGTCPASHPVALPSLTLIVHYPITGDPGTITLASGSEFSGHADFFNAWDQPFLARAVTECLQTGVRCGVLRSL
ncbi:MAG: DUF1996 domain-containing protein [Chloroflexota bacterium]